MLSCICLWLQKWAPFFLRMIYTAVSQTRTLYRRLTQLTSWKNIFSLIKMPRLAVLGVGGIGSPHLWFDNCIDSGCLRCDQVSEMQVKTLESKLLILTAILASAILPQTACQNQMLRVKAYFQLILCREHSAEVTVWNIWVLLVILLSF